MSKIQEEIKLIEVEGTSGGDLLSITMAGDFEIKSIKMDDSIVSVNDKTMLEDLIIAAYSDARRKVQKISEDKMKSITNGLPIPPGMKIPGFN